MKRKLGIIIYIVSPLLFVVLLGGGGGVWGRILGTLSNQTDLQTALNAKLAIQPQKVVSGVSALTLWPRNSMNAVSNATQAMTANVLRAFPWVPPYTFIADSAENEISTPAAGGVVWGVYANESDTTLYPGALLFSHYDTTSAAIKGASLSGANNVTFTAGKVYWIAYDGNSTATTRSLNAASVWGGLGGVPGMGSATQNIGITVNRSMDWTLPITFPASAVVLAGIGAPEIMFRRH